MNDEPRTAPPDRPPEIEASWTDAEGRAQTRRFSRTFRIGRVSSCDIVLPFGVVSRAHVEVRPEAGGWIVHDLGSRNGTFLDGARVAPGSEAGPLADQARLQLGSSGPVVTIRISAPQVAQPPSAGAGGAGDWTDGVEPPREIGSGREGDGTGGAGRQVFSKRTENLSRDAIADRYFGDEDDPDAGEHTRMVRAVFRQRKRRQTRSWLLVVGAFCVVLAGALGALAWQWARVEQTRQLAIDLFYSMKELQLDMARLESAVRATGEDRLLQQLRATRQRVQAMRERYQEYIQDAELIAPDLEPVDRLILDVARVFGECELNMPPEFAAEVKAYIGKWQSSDRMARAIRRIQDRNHVELVAQAMRQHGLPPQFFYLGMQESNFNPQAVGPPTRFGIAKGAWQFIPATAQDYGLRIGPLAAQPVYDPDDERFDFEATTWAAARFLADIYNTDAQASGLLVMASYNWGPGNIIRRIRAMPENPRERNFWALLQLHDIPRETYDYVFYIVSAAVIGENPRLFGFDFDNPLAGYR